MTASGTSTGRGFTPVSAVTLPPDLGGPPTASCQPDLRPGWLSRENRHAGITLATPPTDPSATLYLDTGSATCGQVVHAAVSGPHGSYRLRVVRVGWYGESGGRVVALSPPFQGGPQLDGPRTSDAGTPGWHSSASVRVGPSWPPGLYLVQLMARGRAVQGAPLVVRAPDGAARSPALFVVPAMTWAAYTRFGGRSLYRDARLPGKAGVAHRARTADVARPIEGPGVYAVYRYTVPTISAVEHAGVDVDYAADLDVDATPSLVRGHSELVTGSHTEYVSRRVYDAFQAARDAGTNLAFLGANGFYWQARITRDAQLRPLAITVHRQLAGDPVAATSPSQATVRWRDAPLNRPEAQLLGGQYNGLGVVAPLVVLTAPAWLGWKAGQILPAGYASEVDHAVKGISPPDTQVLAAGAALKNGTEVDAMTTYYVSASGAAVFDAGSVFAGCSTTNSCQAIPIPARTGRFWSDTIVRVVRAFASSRFGADHPQSRSAAKWPTYRELVRRYGRSVAGTTIAAKD
ncbi:MAG: N,N-dimethylformamidase beta subunit family domain-containing protein [Kineosporiaceae bacterium]